jgi:hypothetical protein
VTWCGKGRSAAHGRVERGERRRNRAALFQRMIDGLEGARSVDSETRNCVAREMGSARTRATHHDPVFFFPISSETALPRCPVAGEGCGERRARCVVRDASRRRPVEPEVVFLGDNCAASRIFEPRGAPPGTRGARRGFRRRAPRTHLGTVGGARVPRGRRNECHAREPRRALEHRHSFSSLPKPKKKSFQRDSNPVRATRLLSNLESANFGELLESQTLPQTSRLSVFARDGRAGQCACALAPRRATRDACFALRKRARPHSSRRSRTSTDTRESDARGERVEASEPTRDRRGGVVHDRLAFSRQSLAE